MTLRTSANRAFIYLVALCLSGLFGCQNVSYIHLTQPSLNRWQRDLDLRSEQVYWAPESGIKRVLAEFPLPGATAGKPMYLLYCRFPYDSRIVTFGAEARNAASSEESAVTGQGFFIQTRGEFSGLAYIIDGTIECLDDPESSQRLQEFQVDVTCEDGTQVNGRFQARRNDWTLDHFEQFRRPGDVQILVNRAGPTATQAADHTP
jgi:hypothetical protein